MLPIVFSSTDQGAPVLNNAPGSLISVLDACLVSGFNSVGIFSITITDNVATVVTSAGHGLVVGNRVTVTGVSIAAALGDKTVASVVNSTTFTYPCVNANNTESPVSATIKRTPLGWIKEFNKTNVAMYKMSDPASYGQRLCIDDTAGFDAISFGVINPTSVDDYLDRFPKTAQVRGNSYWTKGMNNTSAKKWWVVGDERFFYYICEGSAYYGQHTETSYSYMVGTFGDVLSYKNAEAFGAIWTGCPGPTNSYPDSPLLQHHNLAQDPGASGYGRTIARDNTGLEDSPTCAFIHPGGVSPGSSSAIFPSQVDNGLILASPSFISERKPSQNHPVRGILPGLLVPFANYIQFPNSSQKPWEITTTDGSGVKALLWSYCFMGSSAAYTLVLDTSRLWR
mgnify:CR=1 FL=1